MKKTIWFDSRQRLKTARRPRRTHIDMQIERHLLNGMSVCRRRVTKVLPSSSFPAILNAVYGVVQLLEHF